MNIFAFVLACLAVACFVWASRPHPRHTVTNWAYVGVALFIASWIAFHVVTDAAVTIGA
jgi:hypothetical protein